MADAEPQFQNGLVVDQEELIVMSVQSLLSRICNAVDSLVSKDIPIHKVIETVRGKLTPGGLLVLGGKYEGGEAHQILEALSPELAQNGVHVIVMTASTETAQRVEQHCAQVMILHKPFSTFELDLAVTGTRPFQVLS